MGEVQGDAGKGVLGGCRGTYLSGVASSSLLLD